MTLREELINRKKELLDLSNIEEQLCLNYYLYLYNKIKNEIELRLANSIYNGNLNYKTNNFTYYLYFNINEEIYNYCEKYNLLNKLKEKFTEEELDICSAISKDRLEVIATIEFINYKGKKLKK